MSNTFAIAPNVVTLPWLRGIQVLPRRRMKFADRAAYDAWERWYIHALIDASKLGYPAAERMFEELAEQFGVAEPVTFDNAQSVLGLIASGHDIALDIGVRAAQRQGRTIRADAPPLPRVWPGPRHPANLAAILREDAVLRYSVSEQAAA